MNKYVWYGIENWLFPFVANAIPSDLGCFVQIQSSLSIDAEPKGLQSGWIAAAHLEWFPSSTMLWRRAGTGTGATWCNGCFNFVVVHIAVYTSLLDLIHFDIHRRHLWVKSLEHHPWRLGSGKWVSCSDCSSACIVQCKCVHLCNESKVAIRLPNIP